MTKKIGLFSVDGPYNLAAQFAAMREPTAGEQIRTPAWKFWNAILAGNVKEVKLPGTEDTMLILPAGVKWLAGCGREMYVRKSYRDIFDIVQKTTCDERLEKGATGAAATAAATAAASDHKTQCILVLGSPGVGKSMFLGYVILRLLRLFGEKLGRTPRIRCFCGRQDMMFEPDGRVVRIDVSSDSHCDVVLGDGAQPSRACGAAYFTMQVSSPDYIEHKRFQKEMHEHGDCLHMPLWNLGEFENRHAASRDPHKGEVSLMKSLYCIYGGDARMVLAKPKPSTFEFEGVFADMVREAAEMYQEDIDMTNPAVQRAMKYFEENLVVINRFARRRRDISFFYPMHYWGAFGHEEASANYYGKHTIWASAFARSLAEIWFKAY